MGMIGHEAGGQGGERRCTYGGRPFGEEAFVQRDGKNGFSAAGGGGDSSWRPRGRVEVKRMECSVLFAGIVTC